MKTSVLGWDLISPVAFQPPQRNPLQYNATNAARLRVEYVSVDFSKLSPSSSSDGTTASQPSSPTGGVTSSSSGTATATSSSSVGNHGTASTSSSPTQLAATTSPAAPLISTSTASNNTTANGGVEAFIRNYLGRGDKNANATTNPSVGAASSAANENAGTTTAVVMMGTVGTAGGPSPSIPSTSSTAPAGSSSAADGAGAPTSATTTASSTATTSQQQMKISFVRFLPKGTLPGTPIVSPLYRPQSANTPLSTRVSGTHVPTVVPLSGRSPIAAISGGGSRTPHSARASTPTHLSGAGGNTSASSLTRMHVTHTSGGGSSSNIGGGGALLGTPTMNPTTSRLSPVALQQQRRFGTSAVIGAPTSQQQQQQQAPILRGGHVRFGSGTGSLNESVSSFGHGGNYYNNTSNNNVSLVDNSSIHSNTSARSSYVSPLAATGGGGIANWEGNTSCTSSSNNNNHASAGPPIVGGNNINNISGGGLATPTMHTGSAVTTPLNADPSFVVMYSGRSSIGPSTRTSGGVGVSGTLNTTTTSSLGYGSGASSLANFSTSQAAAHHPQNPSATNNNNANSNLHRQQLYNEAVDLWTGGVILYAHGAGEDLASSYTYFESLATETQCLVVAFDYFGYGYSSGFKSDCTEANAYAAIEAVYNHITRRLRIDPRRIVLMGRSLGTGPVVELAHRDAVRAAGLAGIILISPMYSAASVVKYGSYVPSFLDIFNNHIKIAHINTCPILIIHGDRDEVIPYWHAEKLYDIAYNARRHEQNERLGIPNNIIARSLQRLLPQGGLMGAMMLGTPRNVPTPHPSSSSGPQASSSAVVGDPSSSSYGAGGALNALFKRQTSVTSVGTHDSHASHDGGVTRSPQLRSQSHGRCQSRQQSETTNDETEEGNDCTSNSSDSARYRSCCDDLSGEDHSALDDGETPRAISRPTSTREKERADANNDASRTSPSLLFYSSSKKQHVAVPTSQTHRLDIPPKDSEKNRLVLSSTGAKPVPEKGDNGASCVPTATTTTTSSVVGALLSARSKSNPNSTRHYMSCEDTSDVGTSPTSATSSPQHKAGFHSRTTSEFSNGGGGVFSRFRSNSSTQIDGTASNGGEVSNGTSAEGGEGGGKRTFGFVSRLINSYKSKSSKSSSKKKSTPAQHADPYYDSDGSDTHYYEPDDDPAEVASKQHQRSGASGRQAAATASSSASSGAASQQKHSRPAGKPPQVPSTRAAPTPSQRGGDKDGPSGSSGATTMSTAEAAANNTRNAATITANGIVPTTSGGGGGVAPMPTAHGTNIIKPPQTVPTNSNNNGSSKLTATSTTGSTYVFSAGGSGSVAAPAKFSPPAAVVLLTVEGCGHHDLEFRRGRHLYAQINNFLTKFCGQQSGGVAVASARTMMALAGQLPSATTAAAPSCNAPNPSHPDDATTPARDDNADTIPADGDESISSTPKSSASSFVVRPLHPLGMRPSDCLGQSPIITCDWAPNTSSHSQGAPTPVITFSRYGHGGDEPEGEEGNNSFSGSHGTLGIGRESREGPLGGGTFGTTTSQHTSGNSSSLLRSPAASGSFPPPPPAHYSNNSNNSSMASLLPSLPRAGNSPSPCAAAANLRPPQPASGLSASASAKTQHTVGGVTFPAGYVPYNSGAAIGGASSASRPLGHSGMGSLSNSASVTPTRVGISGGTLGHARHLSSSSQNDGRNTPTVRPLGFTGTLGTNAANAFGSSTSTQ